MRYLVTAVVATALLAGCASFGDKTLVMPKGKLRDAGDLAATQTLSAAQVDASAWPARQWWHQFNDPALDTLIADALKDNPTLDLAAARLRRAEALATTAHIPLVPLFSLKGDSTYQRFSENFYIPPPFGGSWWWQNQGQITGTFDTDFRGKNRAAYEAAVGQARAAAVDTLSAELTLTTSLTRGYIALARASDQLDLAQQTLDARQKVLQLARDRVSAGLDSQVDLKQVEATIPAAREQIAVWQETLTLTRNQLAALSGRGPDAGATIPRPRSMTISSRGILPSAIPAELLGRRPDVIAQRLRVEAALRDVAAGEAAFYPNIDLNLFAGLQSLGFTNFIGGDSFTAGIGPAFTLPFFGSGRLRADLKARSADTDAAIANYRQAMITGLQEIADELASLKSVAAQSTEQVAAVTVLQQAYDLTVLRYKEGLGTYIQVLTAETQLLAQKSLAADLRARDLDLAVAVVRSLGGGFETLSDGTRLAALMPPAATRVSFRGVQP